MQLLNNCTMVKMDLPIKPGRRWFGNQLTEETGLPFEVVYANNIISQLVDV